ncbi:MAG: hypothetical protein R3B13_08995 [Polyangiaceae bacterium]
MRTLVGFSLIASGLVAFAACGADGGGVQDNGFTTGGGSNADSGSGGGTAATGGGTINVSCTLGEKKCNGSTPQTCGVTGWTSSPDCEFICDQGQCVGTCKPGDSRCTLEWVEKCDAKGSWQKPTSCEFGCDAATNDCKTGCSAGEFNCYGNEIRQCQPGPPSQWVATGTTCNAFSGQTCDAQTGTCKSVTPIGGTQPTGKYYQYAIFKTNDGSGFLGGNDVTSFGDRIYINRQGQYIDEYQITLVDSDNDGKLQPNQHPDNPKATGPMEQRVLTLIKSYSKASDNAPTSTASTTSLYAWSNNEVFSLGPTRNGSVTEYVFATQATTVVAQPTTTQAMSFLGYGHFEQRWYSGWESNRRVYSFHEPTKAWVLEFGYPDLAGTHMDGMDVVVSPKTGEQFVYVSDMTSDFIGQYRRTPTGWEQSELFEYNDATSSAVEGFGFGAFNHFWAASGSILFELGGGDLQEDVGECPDGAQVCGPGLPACGAKQTCRDGCCADEVQVR